MIHPAHNREGYYATNDNDGASTAYYATRALLAQALRDGTAEFSGGLSRASLDDEVHVKTSAIDVVQHGQMNLF
jgi:hypothetical protein